MLPELREWVGGRAYTLNADPVNTPTALGKCQYILFRLEIESLDLARLRRTSSSVAVYQKSKTETAQLLAKQNIVPIPSNQAGKLRGGKSAPARSYLAKEALARAY